MQRQVTATAASYRALKTVSWGRRRSVLGAHILGALAALSLGASTAQAESHGRFFLFIASDVPTQTLVDAAYAVAEKDISLKAVTAETRVGQAFPDLFASRPANAAALLKSRLADADTAFDASDFSAAESGYQQAFELAESSSAFHGNGTALIDAALRRYRVLTAINRNASATKHLSRFAVWGSSLVPTRGQHPPAVLATWQEHVDKARATQGQLAVDVLPLALHRSGTCQLVVDGVQQLPLPLTSPLMLPYGPHLITVTCGTQRSWPRRVVVDANVQSVQVPVRAMGAARADSASGGIVMVAPAPGDAEALIDTLSAAGGLAGALVIQASDEQALVGRWDARSAKPVVSHIGRVSDDDIVGLEAAGVVSASSSGDAGEANVLGWTLLGGGAAAAVAGGVFFGLAAGDASDIEGLDPALGVTAGSAEVARLSDQRDGRLTTGWVLTGVGVAVGVTGLVLLLLDDDDDDDDGGDGQVGSLAPALSLDVGGTRVRASATWTF